MQQHQEVHVTNANGSMNKNKRKGSKKMKRISLLLIICFLMGCSTLPPNLPTEQELFKRCEDVCIRTYEVDVAECDQKYGQGVARYLSTFHEWKRECTTKAEKNIVKCVNHCAGVYEE
jgi:hypothetical protein